MGSYKKGILGPFRGLVGTVIGSSWLGRKYMRSVPDSVRNPKSTAQQLVRARFSILATLAARLQQACMMGFKQLAASMQNTTRAVFMSKNWDATSAVSPREVVVDYSKLKISSGSTPNVIFGRADFGEQTHLTITVPFGENDGDPNRTSANDQVYLVAYGPDIDAVAVSTPAARSSRRATLVLPDEWDGTSVQLYGFTIGNAAYNMDRASDTAYLGHAEIQ